MNCESGKIDFLQVKGRDVHVANLSSALKFKRTECGHLDRFTNLYVISEFTMSL